MPNDHSRDYLTASLEAALRSLMRTDASGMPPNEVIEMGLRGLLANGVPAARLKDVFDPALLETLAAEAPSIHKFPERFRVRWEFDSDAATPNEAAREAWSAMTAVDSQANFFAVVDQQGVVEHVDLFALDDDNDYAAGNGMRP